MPLYLGIDNVYSLDPLFYTYRERIPPTSSIRFTHHPSEGYGDYNVYGPFTNHSRGVIHLC